MGRAIEFSHLHLVAAKQALLQEHVADEYSMIPLTYSKQFKLGKKRVVVLWRVSQLINLILIFFVKISRHALISSSSRKIRIWGFLSLCQSWFENVLWNWVSDRKQHKRSTCSWRKIFSAQCLWKHVWSLQQVCSSYPTNR